jgi:hypothetical protein
MGDSADLWTEICSGTPRESAGVECINENGLGCGFRKHGCAGPAASGQFDAAAAPLKARSSGWSPLVNSTPYLNRRPPVKAALRR